MSLIVAAARIVVSVWVVSGLLLSMGIRQVPIIRTVWAELRPFYLPAVVVVLGQRFATGHIWGWDMFLSACNILNWFFFKDADDDDRWKRRGRKALEKITATDRGLVVVPASDGAS